MLINDVQEDFRSAFVAVVGRPNVGKSTLINRLLGQELSVVSPKAQTTRNRISAIINYPGAQIIFHDTPGFHHSSNTLNLSLVTSAKKAAVDSDLILFLAQPRTTPSDENIELLDFLKSSRKPVIVAINKTDLISKTQLRAIIENYIRTESFRDVVGVSALTGEGTDSLIKKIISLSPKGAPPITIILACSGRILLRISLRTMGG